MKKINIILALVSTVLIAQNTIEDVEAPSIVENMSPSVIDMNVVEDMVAQKASLRSVNLKSISHEKNENDVEMVNGVMKKKIKKSVSSSVTKLDEEAEEVENLEPAGVTSL